MNNLVSLDIIKAMQRVTPKQPEEIRVQRQLESWLDPGWCMTAPGGSESKVKVRRKRKPMWWWIAGALMFLGLMRLVSRYAMEGLIFISLVLVIVIALVRLIRGKMLLLLEGRN